MNNGIKIASLGGVLLAGSMLVSQTAFAQFNYASVPDCNSLSTLQDWADASDDTGSSRCVQQDKLWTLTDFADLGGATEVAFDLNVIDGLDFHELTLSNFGGAGDLGDGTYDFAYEIEIVDTGLGEPSFRFFQELVADTDVTAAPSTSASKDADFYTSSDPDSAADDALLESSNVDSVNGVPDSFACTVCGATKVVVNETVTVSGAVISSITNAFTQGDTRIPEPASLALFGIGLAGAGFASRRRRKS